MEFLEPFENLVKNPDLFLSAQNDNVVKIKNHLQTLYSSMKKEETNIKSSSLPELIVENFDHEQIWQQLELQNEEFFTRALTSVSSLIVKKNKLLFEDVQNLQPEIDEDDSSGVEVDEQEKPSTRDATSDESDGDSLSEDDLENNEFDKKDQEDNNLIHNDNDEIDDLEFSDEDKFEENKTPHLKAKLKKSIVDDDFFRLAEMEQFLNQEERRENDKEADSGNNTENSAEEEEEEEEDDIDIFNDGDAEFENPKYDDFFGKPDVKEQKDKRNKFFASKDNEFEEEAEEERRNKRKQFLESQKGEDTEEFKSTFELREERLQKKISHIENEAISEKPWQLKGEISADIRPQNSLLETVVEFDMTTRPAPVITEETTLKLEDIIRQRIKDKSFDSVQRKEKPVESPLEYKKKLVLDQEKSKLSLAQIYENEYLQQKEALDPASADKPEEVPELHKEIEKQMNALFMKLDALSNFHFTPKPVAPELKIVNNVPAINMEEVAPVAASDATLLAPEEIKHKNKGDIIGASEKSKTDKKRERRLKKKKQHQHAKEKLKKQEGKKLDLGLLNKNQKKNHLAKEQMKRAIKTK